MPESTRLIEARSAATMARLVVAELRIAALETWARVDVTGEGSDEARAADAVALSARALVKRADDAVCALEAAARANECRADENVEASVRRLLAGGPMQRHGLARMSGAHPARAYRVIDALLARGEVRHVRGLGYALIEPSTLEAA